jgi:hypothetical protein
LQGRYEKFTSNGGWSARKEMSLDAFSHFTYNSWPSLLARCFGSRVLVCDLQGVRFDKGYVLTDPAIISDVPGWYGPTDLGHDGIRNYFYHHRCSHWCKTWWPKADPCCVFHNPPARTSFDFEVTKLLRAP